MNNVDPRSLNTNIKRSKLDEIFIFESSNGISRTFEKGKKKMSIFLAHPNVHMWINILYNICRTLSYVFLGLKVKAGVHIQCRGPCQKKYLLTVGE